MAENFYKVKFQPKQKTRSTVCSRDIDYEISPVVEMAKSELSCRNEARLRHRIKNSK